MIQQNTPEDLNLHCENLGVCVHYHAHKISPLKLYLMQPQTQLLKDPF